VSQFRWISKVLVGAWLSTPNAALSDALAHGQAVINEGVGEVIILRAYAFIETRSLLVPK
jgi:hypothetical protein